MTEVIGIDATLQKIYDQYIPDPNNTSEGDIKLAMVAYAKAMTEYVFELQKTTTDE
jgi:hypothetical protein